MGLSVGIIMTGLMARSIVNHVFYMMHGRLKTKIRNMEAHDLRLNARMRKIIKHKVKSIRSNYTSIILRDSKEENLLCEMYNNPMTTDIDFQNYFNCVEQINSYLKSKRKDYGAVALEHCGPQWSSLFVYVSQTEIMLDQAFLSTLLEFFKNRKKTFDKIANYNRKYSQVGNIAQVDLINIENLTKLINGHSKGVAVAQPRIDTLNQNRAG